MGSFHNPTAAGSGRRPHRQGALALLLLLPWLQPSCDDPATPAPADPTTECTDAAWEDTPALLQTAKSQWEAQGRDNYTFTRTWWCECRFEYQQPLTLHVHAGRVVSVYDALGQKLPPEAIEGMASSTIESLFTLIEQAIALPADDGRICFDSDRGYPRWIYIDYDLGQADEEVLLQIELVGR